MNLTMVVPIPPCTPLSLHRHIYVKRSDPATTLRFAGGTNHCWWVCRPTGEDGSMEAYLRCEDGAIAPEACT